MCRSSPSVPLFLPPAELSLLVVLHELHLLAPDMERPESVVAVLSVLASQIFLSESDPSAWEALSPGVPESAVVSELEALLVCWI